MKWIMFRPEEPRIMRSNHQECLDLAYQSLVGLSVGDAFGGFFEGASIKGMVPTVEKRLVPFAKPWRFTDDTNMALSIYEVLRKCGEIDQDMLAASFAAHFEGGRGYGMGARKLLTRIRDGAPWRESSHNLFSKQGSFGNGGAMRVAPVGAYFAAEVEAAAENAARSAEVTHAHPEGIAGGIAVAVAAAYAWRFGSSGQLPARHEFNDQVLSSIPDSEVRHGAAQARDLPAGLPIREVVNRLGNGSRVSAMDTVPFALWCAGEQLNNYEEAIWLTLSGGGDADTTCAMVGGIVVAYTGLDAVPAKWLDHREALPDWPFEDADDS
jgi:ADP-ribosylglycohydrolase